MRKGPLLAYLFIMLAALVGYMFLDMNISRAENQAGDSMKMAVITMLQSECSVNIQAMDRDAGRDHADIRVSGLKKFASYAGKNIKLGDQAGKTWQELKQRAAQAGMLSAPGGDMRLGSAKEADAAALDRDLKDFMSRAVENGFDFNF
jgi:hypothetical protein